MHAASRGLHVVLVDAALPLGPRTRPESVSFEKAACKSYNGSAVRSPVPCSDSVCVAGIQNLCSDCAPRRPNFWSPGAAGRRAGAPRAGGLRCWAQRRRAARAARRTAARHAVQVPPYGRGRHAQTAVLFLAARTLNAKGQPRVILLRREERLRAACQPRQDERCLKSAPNPFYAGRAGGEGSALDVAAVLRFAEGASGPRACSSRGERARGGGSRHEEGGAGT